MSDRKNPFIEIGFPEYAGIHMMPPGLLDRAAKHENARQRVVSSILVELNMMAIIGVIEKDAKISLDGAAFQSLKGSSDSGTEAAHCAPRQILVNGKPANLAFKDISDGFRLKVLFGETDILPANFNKCDSRVERSGIVEGFLKACELSVNLGHFGGILHPASISVSSAAAYEIYSQKAYGAFTKAIIRMKEKLRALKIRHRDKVNWTEQLMILEKYRDTLSKGEGKAEGLSFSKLTGLTVVYKMIEEDPGYRI